MNPIRAVSFDAAGTLFRASPSVGFHYADVAKSFGISADPEVLEARFRNVFHARGGLSSLRDESSESAERAWWKETVILVFKDLKTPPDIDPFFDALYRRFASQKAWALFPEVMPALNALRKLGMTLAVLSNWDSRLFTVLEALNLRPYFKEVIISARAGAAKPHRLIFEECSRAVRLPPSDILHVGDHFLSDVEGAVAAGFRAAYLTRDPSSRENAMVWHGPSIDNLEQVLTLL